METTTWPSLFIPNVLNGQDVIRCGRMIDKLAVGFTCENGRRRKKGRRKLKENHSYISINKGKFDLLFTLCVFT